MRYLFALASCWLTLASGAVWSESDDRAVMRVATIIVPPMVIKNGDTGDLTGTAIKAIERLSTLCDMPLDLIVTPSWNRAYMMAQIGIVDGLVPANFSKERTKFFDFPKTPLVKMSPALIVRRDNPAQTFQGLEMLRGKRVGVRTNALIEEKFDAFVRSGAAVLVERSDSKSLIEELLSGRVDFIADAPAMIIYHMSASRIPERIRFLKPPVGQSSQFLALSHKRAPHLAAGTAVSACFLGQGAPSP